MLFNLLFIKCKDKLSESIVTDTIVDSVADFFSVYPHSALYVESLYYGGRVWHDRGNPEKALSYYKQALDLSEHPLSDAPDAWRADIKGRILSNIAAILFSQRRFKESRPILQESVRLDRHLKDSLGLMYDFKQLAISYLKENQYDSAELYLGRARLIAAGIRPSFIATIDTYRAEAAYSQGKTGEALRLMRPLPAKVDSIARNTTLNLASLIYLKAGIRDTAYIYARELALSKNPLNRRNALQLIASDDLRGFIPEDSISYWLGEYHDCMDDFVKSKKMQTSKSEFIDLKLGRDDAAHRKEIILMSGFCLVCILCIVIFYERRINLFKIAQSSSDCLSETVDLSAQPVGKALQKMIGEGKGIPDVSDVWEKMEREIAESYPGFIPNLRRLGGENLSTRDLHLAMLIKYGVTPTQTCILLLKEKGTISHYRKNLCLHLFGPIVKVSSLDRLIHDI
ncbi:MAG: tetratricopeptide repeat protein [Muribaculaceae bacterium]|nr:tetratricopeptide repeat protein [Muribaculaceae bacterium]